MNKIAASQPEQKEGGDEGGEEDEEGGEEEESAEQSTKQYSSGCILFLIALSDVVVVIIDRYISYSFSSDTSFILFCVRIVLTMILSECMLRKHYKVLQWVGMLVAALPILLVCIFYLNGTQSITNDSMFWMISIGKEILVTGKFVGEEYVLLKTKGTVPFVVGMEGLWCSLLGGGIIAYGSTLPPGYDLLTRMFRVNLDISIQWLLNSTKVIYYILALMVVNVLYHITRVNVIGEYSAVSSVIIDQYVMVISIVIILVYILHSIISTSVYVIIIAAICISVVGFLLYNNAFKCCKAEKKKTLPVVTSA